MATVPPPSTLGFQEQLAYLMSRTRGVMLKEGYDAEKVVVNIDTPGESPFKGIRKAKPSGELDNASKGLFSVTITLRNYVEKPFLATSLPEAVEKAATFVWELDLDAVDTEDE